jgi:hypothetical protein
MVLTVSFVLSPVIGLFCHRRSASCPAKLDASVEASGPHDFAVRYRAIRQRHTQRPPHPAPNVRDDRETPLCRTGWNQNITVSTLPSIKIRKFRNLVEAPAALLPKRRSFHTIRKRFVDHAVGLRQMAPRANPPALCMTDSCGTSRYVRIALISVASRPSSCAGCRI